MSPVYFGWRVLEDAKFHSQYSHGQRAMKSSVIVILLATGIVFAAAAGSTRQVIFSKSINARTSFVMSRVYWIVLLNNSMPLYPSHRARRFTLNHHDLMTPKSQEHELPKHFRVNLRSIVINVSEPITAELELAKDSQSQFLFSRASWQKWGYPHYRSTSGLKQVT